MPSRSSAYLDLRDLTLRGGEHFERDYPLEMAPIILGGQRYDVLLPEGVTVTVDRVAGGSLVAVSTDATVYGPCSRCLREVVFKLRAEEQEFVPTSKEGWDVADLSAFVDDMVVDVSGIAQEAVVLGLPTLIVCREECPGLCSVCGKDLNEGPCGCPPLELDHRWAKLKDFAGDAPVSP
ncbi:MAG TPA: DUF177 domain-containing protein [Thermoleophilia bacterium]